MHEMIRGYLKNNDIQTKDSTYVNAIMCDIISVILEDILNQERMKNWVTLSTIPRTRKLTGDTPKDMHISNGDMHVAIPHDYTITENMNRSLSKISEYGTLGHGYF